MATPFACYPYVTAKKISCYLPIGQEISKDVDRLSINESNGRLRVVVGPLRYQKLPVCEYEAFATLDQAVCSESGSMASTSGARRLAMGWADS